MGTLVSTIIDNVRDRLNEVSTTFFTDDVMIRAANQAQHFVVKENMPLEETSTTVIDSTETNPEQYALPSDCLAINRVTLDNKDLFVIDFQEIKEAGIDTTLDTGSPKTCWEWDDTLFLYPTPGSGVNGQTLKIWYWCDSANITLTTNTLDVKGVYDDIIITYMMYICLIRDRKNESAQFQLEECLTKLKRLRAQKAKNRLKFKPPRFRRSDNLMTRDPLYSYRFRRVNS